MARVRMYHAASNRYQWDAAENFEVFHQPEGWVLAPEDGDAPSDPPGPAPDATAEAPAEPVAETPKRGRSK